jgi:hypothetical protein
MVLLPLRKDAIAYSIRFVGVAMFHVIAEASDGSFRCYMKRNDAKFFSCVGIDQGSRRNK